MVVLIFGIIFLTQKPETTASVEAAVAEDPVLAGDKYQLTLKFTVPSIGPSTKTISVYRAQKPRSEGYGYRDIPDIHKKGRTVTLWYNPDDVLDTVTLYKRNQGPHSNLGVLLTITGVSIIVTSVGFLIWVYNFDV